MAVNMVGRGLDNPLRELLEPAVSALGYELVGVQYLVRRGGSLLRIYIDHEDGISLEDCERVSRQITGVLDVEDPIQEAYQLEVSSPGADRPLFLPEHFQRFQGQRARLKLDGLMDGRRAFDGILVGFEDGHVVLNESGTEYRIALVRVSTARLVPDI